MVYCYKTITESPRRSPRKQNTSWHGALPDVYKLQDDTSMGSIPEREWRLLAALAKKRIEEDERGRLAKQFHKMWEEEKKGREVMLAETSNQYRRFINKKRDEERVRYEQMRLIKNFEQHLQTDNLLDNIRKKDLKTRELLAWKSDKKTSELVNRAIEDEARAFLAAERRSLQESTTAWRKQIEVEQTKKRADNADKRRNQMLREYSRRLAISNTLNSFDTAFTRGHLAANEAARREQYALLTTLARERGDNVLLARDMKKRKARAMAARCELWREVVRGK